MAKTLGRIGVFVCHCGLNIAASVDVEKVVREIAAYPAVAHAENYIYMCSDPGQERVRQAVKEKGLDGLVMANCTPSLHERTFRNLAASEGLNPYHCEVANIREQCSWPHANDGEMATRKALTIIRQTVERLRLNMALTPSVVPLNKRVLVIGAGIAGMRAALDVADSGYDVVLVEKSSQVGGHALQLSGTFPTLEQPRHMIAPMVQEVVRHPRITLYTSSEVEEVTGYVGNFNARIRNGMTSTDETCVEERVGAIIVATGYDLFPKDRAPEYVQDPDVLDGLQFERVLSRAGSVEGGVRRPSDGAIPKEVVFVSCVGSRDPEHGVSYCSRVCCMYIAKQAVMYRRAVPDGQAYVFHMDVRSDAKGYEEFVQDAMEQHRVMYLRGRVSRVFRDGDKLKVWGVDTLIGKNVEVSADLVVLATAMVPSPGAKDLARKLNIISDEYGFFTEAHIKLRPVEALTSGIFLAGTAQWPRDLPDTISSASGAASKVLSLFSRQELLHEPTVARVDEEVCTGCGQCVSACAYNAIEINDWKRVAEVNPAVCEGCGACAATCPSNAVQHRNWTPAQFFEMIDQATVEYV
jgi:heterodisulfide reductase subunit A